jgi:lysyl-tRNA synthetase class I
MSRDTYQKHKLEGVIIQAWPHGENCVRVQIKVDGTEELRWVEVLTKPPPPALPNAPKTQTCEECGRRAKRTGKTSTTATYCCSAGHQTVISIKGE